MRYFQNRIVFLVQVFLVLRENGYAVENIILQGEYVIFVAEIPVEAFSIVYLVKEAYFQFIGEGAGNSVEFGNAAVVVDYRNGITQRSFQMVAHRYEGLVFRIQTDG